MTFTYKRCATIVVLAFAASALASFPAIVAAKTTSKSRVPSCASFSRKALADLAQTGPLTLRKKIGPLCEFKGFHKGHYEPQFELEVIPYIRSIWDTAQHDAITMSKKNGSQYGEFNSKLFWVSGDKTDKGLSPCMPDNGSPGNGDSTIGPACSPEPTMDHFNAYGYGTDTRVHLQLMISVGVTGQQGDVHLSHMISLVQQILSGKIH